MPAPHSFVRSLLLLALVFSTAGAASAQTGANVAVVVNENSPDSVDIGQYYASRRGVPETNIVRIRTSVEETISRPVYAATVEGAIARALLERNLVDRILYIVLTKGTPLRIAGTAGANATGGSVDSELTLLYRRLTGATVPFIGSVENPYFAGDRPIGELARFNRRTHDIYLVTRLDGFSVPDVRALIDRAQRPARTGRIVLDRRGDPPAKIPDGWLGDAAKRLEGTAGPRVELAESPDASNAEPVLGYASWGAADPANRRRRLGLTFAPGALAITFAGSDARTFVSPPAGWAPDPARPRQSWVGDSPQSLLGDLVAEGITGAAGNAADPLVGGLARPQIVFPAYLAGFTLAEAFYLAMPSLGWQGVVLGDPLCRPFEGPVLGSSEIDEGIDPATMLPAYFARRRSASVRSRAPNVPEEAVPLIVRAEVDLMLGRKDAARTGLEAATKVAPDLPDQQLALALLYDDAGLRDQAVERYRRVVQLDPASAVGHNNLAFKLAEDPATRQEALTHARRAVALEPRNPDIIDTLGWIHHLLGEHAEAERLINGAAQLAPRSAEIRLHAAIVALARGNPAVAEARLKEALALDPSLATRKDVTELQEKLKDRRRP